MKIGVVALLILLCHSTVAKQKGISWVIKLQEIPPWWMGLVPKTLMDKVQFMIPIHQTNENHIMVSSSFYEMSVVDRTRFKHIMVSLYHFETSIWRTLSSTNLSFKSYIHMNRNDFNFSRESSRLFASIIILIFCYPMEILKLMNVPGLTRMQVASHLQVGFSYLKLYRSYCLYLF